MKKGLLILFVCFVGCVNGFAQSKFANGKVKVIHCSRFAVSKPLSDLFDTVYTEIDYSKIKMREAEDKDARKMPIAKYTEADGEKYGDDIAVRQTVMGNKSVSVPGVNWLGQIGAFYPPDPTGAVGPNHYVQAVNSTPVKVYNKVNGQQVGSVHNLASLWGSGATNGGDVIVLYDKYADRWFMSQIGTGGDTNVYIAISTSPDPTSTYYTYTFPTSQFPDYQKFSIWGDGYYMSANQNIDNIYCFERDAMILGQPTARAVSATFAPGDVSSFYVPLPADADGGLPPNGTPLPFFAIHDDDWNGSGQDEIKIWSMLVDWTPPTPTAVITTTPDSVALSAFNTTSSGTGLDIAQPLPTTQMLDGLCGFLNYRAQWRQWPGGFRTVVLNFSVNVNTNQRGIRWVELRQDSITGVWTKHQEGTYAPGTTNRWNGSIAMDDNGSIALCYNKSSSALNDYPSLAYTGRNALDTLGQMTFTETIAYQGTGSQHQTNRWGDYSQTCIDPSDGLTFWHTGEYGYNLPPNCATRIYSFKLPPAVGIAEYQNPPMVVNAFQSGEEINVIATNLPSDDELAVDLFDVSGKMISRKMVKPNGKSFETGIDVSAVSRGTYLVRVGKMNSTFQRVKKIIVQ